MRTTVTIDPQLLSQAARLTGVQQKSVLIRIALEALIARESAHRLAALGGTEKGLGPIRRQRKGAM